ncbi:hypothetical protein GN958_ATG14130 [Phytophthora infestans]|uniref:Uncharacterized protein n=1 Tax=Phytophthora infestans TaxID=4787 RepID=A0A8S9U810_PHYIN|nr:hypothetical protein GN958_ATG14130 [Phytophthora infestans]
MPALMGNPPLVQMKLVSVTNIVTSIVENITNTGELATSSEHDGEMAATLDLTSSPIPIPASPSVRAKRTLNLDYLESGSDEGIANIVFNIASKPAGRPMEKKSVKKAKRRKEFEETKTLVQQVNTYGYITLSDLRKCLGYSTQNHLQRPKGHVVTPGMTKTVESSIRFVLSEALVHKSQPAGRNATARELSESGRMPPHDDIIVSILDVGTFSLTDTDTMYEWHCLKKKNSAAQKLMKWVESKPDTETRRAITSRVPTINMRDMAL